MAAKYLYGHREPLVGRKMFIWGAATFPQSGNPIPILYGGRIIGKIGKVEIAAQQVKTRKTDLVNSEDFSVLRLKQNFLKESSIGILYTRRHTKNGEQLTEPLQDRNTFGVDFKFKDDLHLRRLHFK